MSLVSVLWIFFQVNYLPPFHFFFFPGFDFVLLLGTYFFFFSIHLTFSFCLYEIRQNYFLKTCLENMSLYRSIPCRLHEPSGFGGRVGDEINKDQGFSQGSLWAAILMKVRWVKPRGAQAGFQYGPVLLAGCGWSLYLGDDAVTSVEWAWASLGASWWG